MFKENKAIDFENVIFAKYIGTQKTIPSNFRQRENVGCIATRSTVFLILEYSGESIILQYILQYYSS